MSEENTVEDVHGFLQGTSGGFSMRRLLALIFGIAAIVAGLGSIGMTYWTALKMTQIPDNSWLIILVSWLAPGMVSALFMFFTTWGDVAEVVEKVRK